VKMAERYSARRRRQHNTRACKGTPTSSDVASLAVCSRRVVRAIEEFCNVRCKDVIGLYRQHRRTDELSIGHQPRIKLDFNSLRMVGFAGADFIVLWIRDVLSSSGVSDRGLQDALVLRRWVMLEEDVFDAPEASCSECGDFGLLASCRCVIRSRRSRHWDM
jgi:hypothetical protein